MAEFLNMNGYGIYIWPAYAAALALLGGVLWTTLRRRAQLKRQEET